MNLRLKEYVTIQTSENQIIISGAYGGAIVWEKSEEKLSLLSELKSEFGVTSEYVNKYEEETAILQNKGLLDRVDGVLQGWNMKRNELFYDYVHFDFKRIRNKQVTVLGAGAAGGTIVYMLAQQGLKNITVIDDDVVEKSDIDKTMVYDAVSIGKKKVNALKERVLDNFGIALRTLDKHFLSVEDAIETIEELKPAIVVYAIDPDPKFKLELNRYCINASLPLIHASYSYEKILCGPCVLPKSTACFCGYNEYWRKRTNNTFDYYAVSRLFPSNTIHPSISFNINTLSSIIVKDVIFFLGKDYEKVSTMNKLITISLIDSDIEEYVLSCGFCEGCDASSPT